MKIVTLFFFLSLSIVHSQELKTIELLPPESKNLDDLYFLKDELKDKQIIMLGELTHMYGNIFEMKARIVEYLHQDLGFTTIAMESSMYDIWKMNKDGGFNPIAFNEAIWGVWSSSHEFQRLVDYIDNNNLKVIGFDSQVNNTSGFIEDFFNYCESENIELQLNGDDFGIIIEGVLDNIAVEEQDIEYKKYEKELIRIIKKIEKLESVETNYYWAQFVKNLLACSRDAYYNQEKILTTDFGNKNDNIRDEQMANNLLSYINRNPNEKIICWADNVHIMNDNSGITKTIAKDFVSMGSYVKKELKDKSYSLATIHANDSIYDFGTNVWHATPIKSDSFEDELNNLNKPYLFVSSNQKAMKSSKFTRLLNFVDFTKVRLDQLHDAYIFLENATLPKRNVDTEEVSQIQLRLDNKIAQIAQGENIYLKGQIIDQKDSDPVPFATLIIQKEGKYRVADENGYYELPVRKESMKNTSVEISSLGFETTSILLDSLSDITYLNPKFEELAEVVIKGYLSPATVLKKAISKKKVNHPVEPFNFKRYGKVLISKNDTINLDLELITKDYDRGYLSPYVITQKVEEIKWNINHYPKTYLYSSQFFSYRQNAIRYANILHKRKYKKFKLAFVNSDKIEYKNHYIISFQTERNNWNYTNRNYPTNYSGRVYINKENFAISKVVENWETNLKKEDINKYFKTNVSYNNVVFTTIKEENICNYSDILGDGKYYATNYFNRFINERIANDNEIEQRVFERNSFLYDFEITDVEEIEYEWREKKQTVLNSVKYEKTFWNSFYKRDIKIEK